MLGEASNSERAGAVFGAFVTRLLSDVLNGLSRSGLAHGEGFGDVEADSGILSVGGRGDKGTFQRLASSGRPSSPSCSVYSASSSLIDFLLGCHDVLLLGV